MTTVKCPACQSTALRYQGDEWRCPDCYASSDGYQIRRPDDPPDGRLYSDHELLAALRAHAEMHGVAPSRATWDTDRPEGAPSQHPYITRYGSWSAALAAAGLTPGNIGIGRNQRPTAETRQLVADWIAEHPDASKRAAFRAVGNQLGRDWTSIRSAYERGASNSQPATNGEPSRPVAPAETAAPPPPPDVTAVTTPAGEDSSVLAPETPPASGMVEAVLPTTEPDVESHYGFEVDRTDLATYPPEPERGPDFGPIYIDQGSVLNRRQIEHLRRHGADLVPDTIIEGYANALLNTIADYEIVTAGDHYLFERLCDRLERLLGLAAA